jgi:hypothetical protein
MKKYELMNLASEIRAEHEQCIRSANQAVIHAMKCGDMLIKAKSKIDHGGWLN